MQAAETKIAAQLEFWNLRIDHLAARTQMSCGEPSFDALVHIDELKALHAIARSKLDELKASGVLERPRLEVGLLGAVNDLAVAIKDPLTRRRR